MVALIDVDDTLAQLQRDINRYLNRFATKPYSWRGITYDLRKGLDLQYQQLVDEFLSQPNLTLKARIYPSVPRALQQLKKAGFEVHIASARKAILHQATIDWLAKHGIDIYVDEVHPRPDTTGSHQFKNDVAQKIGATVAFDDTYDVALSLAENGVQTYLIDKPWNQGLPKHPLIKRSRSFSAAVNHLLAGSLLS